eukprot:981000-Rhodomonas_salina.1
MCDSGWTKGILLCGESKRERPHVEGVGCPMETRWCEAKDGMGLCSASAALSCADDACDARNHFDVRSCTVFLRA